MKRQLLIVVLLVAVLFCSCGHEHEWQNATCVNPQKCIVCEEVQGEPIGHSWKEATCETPKQCTVCEEVQGEPLNHDWDEATCTNPSICKTCGEIQGVELGHDFEGTTCTNPGTCLRCGEVEEIYGHNWKDATCIAPRKCAVCDLTDGTPLGHEVKNGVCIRCGKDFLTSDEMVVDVAYLLKNGEITEVTPLEQWMGFVLHDTIKDIPVFGANQLIVRTYNMSYIYVKKVEFVDDRFYNNFVAEFERLRGKLYYRVGSQNREVERIDDLAGNTPVNQLPLEEDRLVHNQYFLYGPSPQTEYTVGYWDGPDYKERTFTMKYSRFYSRDEYRCEFKRTYDGYSIIDLSSLETGYYMTEGLRANGLIYVDNG